MRQRGEIHTSVGNLGARKQLYVKLPCNSIKSNVLTWSIHVIAPFPFSYCVVRHKQNGFDGHEHYYETDRTMRSLCVPEFCLLLSKFPLSVFSVSENLSGWKNYYWSCISFKCSDSLWVSISVPVTCTVLLVVMVTHTNCYLLIFTRGRGEERCLVSVP